MILIFAIALITALSASSVFCRKAQVTGNAGYVVAIFGIILTVILSIFTIGTTVAYLNDNVFGNHLAQNSTTQPVVSQLQDVDGNCSVKPEVVSPLIEPTTDTDVDKSIHGIILLGTAPSSPGITTSPPP